MLGGMYTTQPNYKCIELCHLTQFHDLQIIELCEMAQFDAVIDISSMFDIIPEYIVMLAL